MQRKFIISSEIRKGQSPLERGGKPRLGELQTPPLEQDKRCEATSSKMSPKGRYKMRFERSEKPSYISCNEDAEVRTLIVE